MSAESFSTRVTTGRVSFVDPTTLVYVPWRATAADANAALAELRKNGISRPAPGLSLSRERVYPVDIFPSDDRDVYHCWFRNDHAELIECTLHVRQLRTMKTPGPWDESNPAEPIDPFSL